MDEAKLLLAEPEFVPEDWVGRGGKLLKLGCLIKLPTLNWRFTKERVPYVLGELTEVSELDDSFNWGDAVPLSEGPIRDNPLSSATSSIFMRLLWCVFRLTATSNRARSCYEIRNVVPVRERRITHFFEGPQSSNRHSPPWSQFYSYPVIIQGLCSTHRLKGKK